MVCGRGTQSILRARGALETWSSGPSTSPLERTMLPAGLTPRRKLALGIAFPCAAAMFAFFFYTSYFRGQLPFLHWHFAAIAAWLAASALSNGLLITELLRFSARSAETWSDQRHFRIALIVSLALLAIQALSVVVGRMTGARAL